MPLPPPPPTTAGSSPGKRQRAGTRLGGGRAAAATPGAEDGALPGDVRWMNRTSAALLLALLALASLAVLVWWALRTPMLPIRDIRLDGELTRNTAATVRASAGPQLAGNFFSMDLQATRAAFEGVPWVRRAVVRRVWPGTLVVTLEEHRAAALWEGSPDGGGSAEKLVNTHGEVFEANVGDVEDDPLPRLAGPEGSAAQMLALHRRLQPAFETLDMAVERLVLSQRGSWRAELDSGAVVELGRGTDDEVVARSERFVRTLPQVAARWKQPLTYADLRHTDGYALRLRGVSTTETPPATPTRPAPQRP